MIADTDFAIAVLNGDEDAWERSQELGRDGVPLKFPTMTVAELYVGVETLGAAEARKVENALQNRTVVELDAEIAREAGRAMAYTDAGVDTGDCVIGATAAVLDEPVLTNNADDFEQIDGVTVEQF